MIDGILNPKLPQEDEITSSLATITGWDGYGYKIKLDGEEASREKSYRANGAFRFFEGERVKVSKISGTYVIEYPVQSSNLGSVYGLNYTKLANASVEWVLDSGGANVSYTSTTDAAVAIRTANKIDLTNINTLCFKMWLRTVGAGALYMGIAPDSLKLPLTQPTGEYFDKYITTSKNGLYFYRLDVSELKGEYYPTICGGAHNYRFRGFFSE